MPLEGLPTTTIGIKTTGVRGTSTTPGTSTTDYSDYDAPTRRVASEPKEGQVAHEEWQGDWLDDPWWNEDVEPWQNRPCVQPLPDTLLGWLLLCRAGLERPERLSIQSAVAHSWSRAAVAQALKDQWPEHELTKRDARKPQEARRDRTLRRAQRSSTYTLTRPATRLQISSLPPRVASRTPQHHGGYRGGSRV